MPLKNPSQGRGNDRKFSPLWRRIQGQFSDNFLARDGTSPEMAEQLYVAKRRGQGLEEDDLRAHIASSDRKLFLVTAPAGLGKTTFLHHTLRRYADQRDVAFVWIDVLREVVDVLHGTSEPNAPVAKVARLINSMLESHVAPRDASPWPWLAFFLEHCVDPAGTARFLRDELRDTQQLSPESRTQLIVLLEQTTQYPEELIRLRIEFLWSIGKRPVIVIDNVDQLRARYIDELGRLAFVLAEGTSGRNNGARVIFATREVHGRRMQGGVGTLKHGELQPADVATMVERRLNVFLSALGRKIAPSETIPLPQGGEFRVAEWLVDEKTPERYLRDVLEIMTKLLITVHTPYGSPVELVQKLNHYNTRVTLIVIGQYIASAHLPWVSLVIALAGLQGEPDEIKLAHLERQLRWPRLFHALFVGTRTNLGNDTSWLYHLFNDGSNDRAGVLIRLRVLKAVAATGTTIADLSRELVRMFGYQDSRTTKVLNDAIEYGLLVERKSDSLVLSDAGHAYLHDMSREFEYLQHVLMDAWTDSAHLVRIRDNEDGFEKPELRFERVLKFADWVRELEVIEYRHVLDSDEEELYETYFEHDTISGSMCDCLVSTTRLASAIGDVRYKALLAETNALKARCTFEAIRTNALQSPTRTE